MDTCGSALSGALVEKVSLGRFSRDWFEKLRSGPNEGCADWKEGFDKCEGNEPLRKDWEGLLLRKASLSCGRHGRQLFLGVCTGDVGLSVAWESTECWWGGIRSGFAVVIVSWCYTTCCIMVTKKSLFLHTHLELTRRHPCILLIGDESQELLQARKLQHAHNLSCAHLTPFLCRTWLLSIIFTSSHLPCLTAKWYIATTTSELEDLKHPAYALSICQH
jgi:hypothetical protein